MVRDDNDMDLRINFLSVDKKIAMDSFGYYYKVGQVVGHEGSDPEDELATILSFEVDEESNEVKAYTDKGHAHIDFFYDPNDPGEANEGV